MAGVNSSASAGAGSDDGSHGDGEVPAAAVDVTTTTTTVTTTRQEASGKLLTWPAFLEEARRFACLSREVGDEWQLRTFEASAMRTRAQLGLSVEF